MVITFLFLTNSILPHTKYQGHFMKNAQPSPIQSKPNTMTRPAYMRRTLKVQRCGTPAARRGVFFAIKAHFSLGCLCLSTSYIPFLSKHKKRATLCTLPSFHLAVVFTALYIIRCRISPPSGCILWKAFSLPPLWLLWKVVEDHPQ